MFLCYAERNAPGLSGAHAGLPRGREHWGVCRRYEASCILLEKRMVVTQQQSPLHVRMHAGRCCSVCASAAPCFCAVKRIWAGFRRRWCSYTQAISAVTAHMTARDPQVDMLACASAEVLGTSCPYHWTDTGQTTRTSKGEQKISAAAAAAAADTFCCFLSFAAYFAPFRHLHHCYNNVMRMAWCSQENVALSRYRHALHAWHHLIHVANCLAT